MRKSVIIYVLNLTLFGWIKLSKMWWQTYWEMRNAYKILIRKFTGTAGRTISKWLFGILCIHLETPFNWQNIALNDNFLPKRKWTYGFLKSRELTYWPDGWQEAFQRSSHHDVRNTDLVRCTAKVNDSKHMLNFLRRCVMCVYLFTPADKRVWVVYKESCSSHFCSDLWEPLLVTSCFFANTIRV